MKKALYFLLKLLLYIVSLLPFALIYMISDLLYITMYRVFGYRKKVVFENLRKSFPDKSEDDIKNIAEKFYRFLCDQIMESAKMLTISEKTVRKRFRLNNVDEIHRHFNNNRPVIAVTGHYGNWEWGILIISILVKSPVFIAFKPIKDKRFEYLINTMRSRFNAVLVPMKSILRKISECKSPYILVLVSDQTPARAEISYFTQFMNQQTPVFLGTEKLAKLSGSPVVYSHIDRIRRGYYECTFETLFEEPNITAEKEITETHTRKLEEIIKRKPELWLWSHRRWKYAPVEDAGRAALDQQLL
ncbi:lysophospholipid acyltransferase family protein [Flavihumibacter sp. R14]|nr:lysophospholipid acyltransferase family protein [Flavihumibacter soli]